jgi:hypothetical protein
MPFMNTSAELANYSTDAAGFIKRLYMCAAMWGCCYGTHREFDMTWEVSGDQAKLLDVADNGIYSFQAEGLLSRFLMFQTPEIAFDELGAFHAAPVAPSSDESPITGDATIIVRNQLVRAQWQPERASEQDWEDMRGNLYAIFRNGFFGGDLEVIDKAIDWLKSGKPCASLFSSAPTPDVKEA